MLPIKTSIQFLLELFIRLKGKYCKDELLTEKNLHVVTFFVIRTLKSHDKSESRQLDASLVSQGRGYSQQFRIGVCRQGSQTLTIFKGRKSRFHTLFQAQRPCKYGNKSYKRQNICTQSIASVRESLLSSEIRPTALLERNVDVVMSCCKFPRVVPGRE